MCVLSTGHFSLLLIFSALAAGPLCRRPAHRMLLVAFLAFVRPCASSIGLLDLFQGKTSAPAEWDEIADLFAVPAASRVDFLSQVNRISKEALSLFGAPSPNQTIAGPEFRWIPSHVATTWDGGAAQAWEAPCFQNNQVSASVSGDTATITIRSSKRRKLVCYDWYLIATASGLWFKTISSKGNHTIVWNGLSKLSDAEAWDHQTNGFRVFRMLDGYIGVIKDLLLTVKMFLPAETHSIVPAKTEALNVKFLKDNVNADFPLRDAGNIDVDENLIQPGDFFGVIRMDGLDPMLAWAMGGTHTGHTTIALKNPETGKMQICESTAKSVYWPVNGIQCTDVHQWILQARNASFHVVWLPLSAAMRQKFNNSKAFEWFKTVQGVNYGYGNLLWGWIDFPELNNPFPLTSTLHMLLPAWADKLGLHGVADLLWNRAFNLRLNTTKLRAIDAYRAAHEQHNLTAGELMSLEERDSFVYAMKANNGSVVPAPSMTCDVFACRAWKEGGLFDGMEFDCAEATNWDLYTLKLFDATQRPQICKQKDPKLPFCQLMGNYQLSLPYYNTRSPVARMFSKCPRGAWPDFDKPIGC